jgi:hypothetical protein
VYEGSGVIETNMYTLGVGGGDEGGKIKTKAPTATKHGTSNGGCTGRVSS